MKNEIVALIPVREGSQRVKEKNFREFVAGRSLLELKINQAKEAGCFDHIYISSDSEKAKKIAIENGVEFLQRSEVMCQAHTPWAEVVEHIMETIPDDPIVTWGLATSPTFNNFSGAVKTFVEKCNEFDSLVAVLPKKSFFLNKFGKGINYNLGYWHPYSQELETYYEVTGACYIGRKSDMAKWKYWFGIRPYLFEVSNIESIDVDTLDDFESAQKIYSIF
jgi:CMP-N-acetylneuraminic acid synthetase